MTMNRNVVFFTEMDEYQHKYENVSCELARMTRIHETLALEGNELPIVFLRLNPDAYHANGEVQKISKTLRYKRTVDLMRTFVPTQPLSVLYLYYDEVDGELDIAADPDFDPVFSQFIVRP